MKLRRFIGRDYVALILATALLFAVIGATISIVYATIVNEFRVFGDAAMQLLTTLFGGIVAILGGYVGGAYSQSKDDDKDKDG